VFLGVAITEDSSRPEGKKENGTDDPLQSSALHQLANEKRKSKVRHCFFVLLIIPLKIMKFHDFPIPFLIPFLSPSLLSVQALFIIIGWTM